MYNILEYTFTFSHSFHVKQEILTVRSTGTQVATEMPNNNVEQKKIPFNSSLESAGTSNVELHTEVLRTYIVQLYSVKFLNKCEIYKYKLIIQVMHFFLEFKSWKSLQSYSL